MFSKKLLSVLVLTSVLATGVIMGQKAQAGPGGGGPGSVLDPLVARSYVEQQVEQKIGQVEQRIINLQARVEKLRNQVASLEQLVSAGGQISNITPRQPVSEPLPQPSPAPTPAPRRGTVNAPSGANIRSGPGINHAKLATVPRQTVLEIIGDNGQWYKVKLADGSTGWIFAELLKVE